MRQIFLDTETTGLESKLGHRIVEIAAVEMLNRRLTGKRFHNYLNPEREVEAGALQVHGLTNDFLQDKPLFLDITRELLEFIDGAELIMHNAPFDVGFLNNELGLAKLQPLENYCHSVTDTLKMAKELHPGKRNNLNALCERYQINNSKRVLHGALLDAEILSDVYLALTGGQTLLDLDTAVVDRGVRERRTREQRGRLKVVRATDEELAAHQERLDQLEEASGAQALFRGFDA